MQGSKHSPLHDRIQKALQDEEWQTLSRLCQQALRKNIRDLQATRLLGHALDQLREPEEALKVYRRGAAFWPKDAELLINYGNVLLNHARNSEALPILEKVCALRPEKAICWIKLAQCCYLLNLNEKGYDAAQKAFETATATEERATSLTMRAIHRRELGQIREAIADCETAIALAPTDQSNHTNRLLFMLSDPRACAADVARAAQEYAATFEPALRTQWPTFDAQAEGPWRRLRIGFLSPDFRVHSVMYFIEGLLAQLDRRQFEVFAFYLFPRNDYVTPRVERHADHFIRLAHLKPEAQVQAIREQQIDVLIDLTGHTGHNGLQAMAHKAAPVQVSWLGFPATTGLQAIDYKITDEITDPEGSDDQYTERLYRLPTLFACYRPMSRNPLWRYQPRYQVRAAPALTNGFVTFGSCNNLGKLTDEVLTLWGRVLAAVPGSRLLIEGKNLDRPDFANAYRQRCQSLGLDPARLDLVAQHTDNQYLTYHRIDIALDPFPLTGGTTTFDVLWMGLPVVSMVGASFKSRMGVGLLSYLGRTEWLAHDAEEYLRIAQELASDVQHLNQLRLGLRQEVEQSPLMREDLYIHHFGEALRVMWLQWLAQRQHPGDEAAQQQAMQQWVQELPPEWSEPPVPGVGLAPGTRVPLHEAHAQLQALVEKAKAQPTPKGDSIMDRHWIAVTELAEKVLCAIPHDPVALACLAEVEHAHGHTEFAVTYLQHATRAMGMGMGPLAG